MIPITLDPAFVSIGLVGRGTLAVRRLAWLKSGGCDPAIYSDAPTPELREAAGARLVQRLPEPEEIAEFTALWVADLPADLATPLAAAARLAKTLVNVEDVLPQCDFHTPAVLRRDRLVIAAATGGASPALAGLVRAKLADAFPEAWGPALDAIANARLVLKSKGATPQEIAADARARLAALGLI